MKRKTRGKDSLIKKIHRKQLIKEVKGKVREGEGDHRLQTTIYSFCRLPGESKFKKRLRMQRPKLLIMNW